MRVSVIGLGKLGAPACVVLAKMGHHVIGADVNAAVVRSLTEACTMRTQYLEPGLAEGLHQYAQQLEFTTDIAGAVERTSVTLIIVPTPSLKDGSFDLQYTRDALKAVAAGLQRDRRVYHVITVTSTVLPGDCSRLCLELESLSGLHVGNGFGFCYNPEFIALGSVIKDMSHPDFILIGESDPDAGATLERMYTSLDAPVQRMNLINAEIAKIALNSYVTCKISFANKLAQMCQRLPGGDAGVVTRAIGLDSRIGQAYLRPGLGFGGPCFPRDNRAFQVVANRVGLSAPLAIASDATNVSHLEELVHLALLQINPGATLGILGLAYKPGTPVTEESPAIALARHATIRARNVVAFDPMAQPRFEFEFGFNIKLLNSIQEVLSEADAVVVATAWPEFKGIGPLHLKAPNIPVLDCWGILTDDFPNKTVIGRNRR